MQSTCRHSARPTAGPTRRSRRTLISVGICRRAAERLEGEIPVLVPAVPYGVRATARTFPPGSRSRGACACSSLNSPELRAHRAREQPPRARAGPGVLRDLGVPLFDVTRRAVAERLTEVPVGRRPCAATRHRSCSRTVRARPQRPHAHYFPAKPLDMSAAIRAGQTSFERWDGPGVLRLAGRGDRRRGRADLRGCYRRCSSS